MATAKQQFVYDLRIVTDAMESLNDRIAAARSEWAKNSRDFKDDAMIYRSAEPNDRDGFAESDIYLLLSELADLQDTALARRLALAQRVGMVK